MRRQGYGAWTDNCVTVGLSLPLENLFQIAKCCRLLRPAKNKLTGHHRLHSKYFYVLEPGAAASNIEKYFDNGLYRDVNDIFGKDNSQRQFFTVPGRGILNDQGGFANWLYGTPPTCKEGNGLQCAGNQAGVSKGPGSDEIQGIGKVKKKNLLTYFGSINKIRIAKIDELYQVKGINKALAESIYGFFHES